MRILLVHNYYRIRGGEDVVVEQELDLLRQSGVDAQLYAVRNTDIRGRGAEIVTGLTAIYNPWSRREFARELAVFKPDIVHVHNFFPRLSPSIFDACRHTGTPTVLTLHNLRIIAPQTIDSIDIPTPATMRDPPWKMIARKGYRGSLAATL